MTPYYSDEWLTIHEGDCRAVLREMEPESVHCVVTSPPYWGLRDYGTPGQLGLEATPEEYVAAMVDVFREVRRVLRADGTVWLTLGDSYNAYNGGAGPSSSISAGASTSERPRLETGYGLRTKGLKPKDLVGIPWRVAFALQQPYYTGTIKDERDRIWLAAMLDAEGCLFIHKRKAGQHNGQGYYRTHDNYGPGVEICNTSAAVVERIQALVGKGSVSIAEGGTYGRKQTLYRWNLRTTESRDFVRELYPYLVAKQQQARILIGCPPSGERAEAAHAALIALHRTSLSDVDFPAPASMYEPGWYLRSDIIWAKNNPMPESVTDRPTKSHEYLFLLSKSARYFWDADAVREGNAEHTENVARNGWVRQSQTKVDASRGDAATQAAGCPAAWYNPAGRNLRSVWTIATAPYPGAHFATFPPKLVEPCIKAGCPDKACGECGAPWERETTREREYYRAARDDRKWPSTEAHGKDGRTKGNARLRVETIGFRPTCTHDAPTVPGVVLDPFAGTGTVGLVAQRLSRRAVLIDLNAEYLAQCLARNAQTPMGLVS